MRARVALATAAEFPDLDEDGPVLVAALGALDVHAEPAVWTDLDLDWSTYDLVVVRATWDYASHRDDFITWAQRVTSMTRLANSAAVLEWNSDKSYLRSLTAAGLPVVPTDWLEPGDVFVPPVEGEYVVKPAVSAGSRDTNRYRAVEHDALAKAHVDGLLAAGRTVMIQPYLREVDAYGESALLFLGGELSHAIRKGPLLTPAMEPVAGLYKEEEVEPRQPSEGELAVADRVLELMADVGPAPRGDLLYARVDLVPDHESTPTLLELELVEPSMFLLHDGAGGARSAQRFATAIAARLADG